MYLCQNSSHQRRIALQAFEDHFQLEFRRVLLTLVLHRSNTSRVLPVFSRSLYQVLDTWRLLVKRATIAEGSRSAFETGGRKRPRLGTAYPWFGAKAGGHRTGGTAMRLDATRVSFIQPLAFFVDIE